MSLESKAFQPNARPSYRDPSVVDYYARATDLLPEESHLFTSYIPKGSHILDLGVGGGRTAPHLSAFAKRYIGIDYSPEMIAACRYQFPELRFDCHDARDLSSYSNGEFDVVVFSFNGIGHLSPDSAREQCLKEVYRVLKPNGWFIFSVHNARGLLIRPRRDGRDVLSTIRGLVSSLAENVRRVVSRLFTRTYWQGAGYLWLNVHGRNRMFLSTPASIRKELHRLGFTVTEHCPDGYPASTPVALTRWYYYAAQKRP